MTCRRSSLAFVGMLAVSTAIGANACGGSGADVTVLPEEDASADVNASSDGADDVTLLDAHASGDVSTIDGASSGNDASVTDASASDGGANDAAADADASETGVKDAQGDAPSDARADVIDVDADPGDADVDAGDFCTGKDDGTACAASGRWACCNGECRNLQTRTNCGGCGITCPDNGTCFSFGAYPNIGNVCGCSNSVGCPTKQSCLVIPQQDTCECQLDGDGCAANQTCQTSVGLAIPRRYCTY